MEFPESIAGAGSNWQAMKGMERLSPEFSGGNSEEVDDKKIEESSEILANLDNSDLNTTAFRLYNLLCKHTRHSNHSIVQSITPKTSEESGGQLNHNRLMDRLNKLTGLQEK